MTFFLDKQQNFVDKQHVPWTLLNKIPCGDNCKTPSVFKARYFDGVSLTCVPVRPFAVHFNKWVTLWDIQFGMW